MSEHYFGARLTGPDRTEFRFWAPSVDAVTLEIDGQPPVAMTAADNGWFVQQASCGAGARYRYRVTPDLAVPDPASHLQDGDVHGWSVVVDHAAYAWQQSGWRGRPWHETVLYELHAGAFGGFAGVTARLPALAALGVTAVELMPIADFPGRHNWGYDGVLPYAPDAAYGTPDELKELVDTAHGLGLMVFLDVVYNHFGPDGNYLGAYAKQFFRDDVQTPWGQAIDFRVAQVRDFFTNNALHWLQTYRFDGLRFDAVHAITGRDWLHEVAAAVRAATPAGHHVHLVVENDDNDAALLRGVAEGLYDGQWNDDSHHALHVLLTGESEGYYQAYTDRPADKLARCLAEGFIFQGDAPLHAGGKLRGTPSGHLPPTAFVNFLQNHDQTGNRAFGERLTALADPQALQAAQALLLLTPAIPLLFMGEESGARAPFVYFTDHAEPALAEAVRDGRRQEFARFAAFSDPARRAQIPDPNAPSSFEQSRPDLTPNATTQWFTHLLQLRRTHLMPGLQDARSLGAQALGEAAVCARWQLGNGRRLTVAINFAAAGLSLANGSRAGAGTSGSGAISADPIGFTAGATVLVATNDADQAVASGSLPARSVLVFLDAA